MDYIKKAERNLINICKEFDDFMHVLDALASFGNAYCHEYVGKEGFFDGLRTMQNAIYREQATAIRRVFAFAGVGGEETQEYARQKFKETFNGEKRYVIMHFLDKYGQIPSSYRLEIDEKFREQARKRLEETEKAEDEK